MNRQEAWDIVCEFVRTDSLRKHALAVEACMRVYARYHSENEDQWGLVGLLHDFDYEIHPTEAEHPQFGARILQERGVPSDVIESILSHGDHLLETHRRRTLRDRALVAVDQLSGLCVAVALVRPTKSVLEVTVASVKKKWKDKAFARAVNREEVARYAEEFGLPLDLHIARVLEALTENADALGLRGSSF